MFKLFYFHSLVLTDFYITTLRWDSNIGQKDKKLQFELFLSEKESFIQLASIMAGGFIITLAVFSLYLLHKGTAIKN